MSDLIRRLEEANAQLIGSAESHRAIADAITALTAGASGGGDAFARWLSEEVCIARNEWVRLHERDWLEDHGERVHPDDFIGKWLADRMPLRRATPASPAAVEGTPKLQRYFPAKPSHPGWEMSPHNEGEWVLWEDVSKWWSAGPFVVSKFEGVGHDAHAPISYSVKGGGMSFNCGTYSAGEQSAQWLASRLNATPQPAAAHPNIAVGVDVTTEGAHVVVIHREREFDTLIYSQFHPLAAAPQPQSCNCEVSAGLASFHKNDCRSITPPAHGDGEGVRPLRRFRQLTKVDGASIEHCGFVEDANGPWVLFADLRNLTTRPTPEAQEARDAARLDFLLDNCAVVKTDGKQWRVEYEWLPEGTEGPFAATKREAIDAAMALRGEDKP